MLLHLTIVPAILATGQHVEPSIVECPKEIIAYVPDVASLYRLETERLTSFTRARRTYSGPSGAILLEDMRYDVHSFSEAGKYLFTFERADGVDYDPVRSIVLVPDGTLLRSRRVHSGTFDVLRGNGKYLSERIFESPRMQFLPESHWRWVVLNNEVLLIGPDNKPAFSTDLRPDGTPLFQTFGFGVTADGALLVAEGYVAPGPSCLAVPPYSGSPRSEDVRTTICQYAANGVPTSMWILPEKCTPTVVLSLGRWVVLAWPEFGGRVFMLLDTEEGRVMEPQLPKELIAERMAGIHSAPDGQALYWVQAYSGNVFTVSLP